jgi:hypothetical protein
VQLFGAAPLVLSRVRIEAAARRSRTREADLRKLPRSVMCNGTPNTADTRARPSAEPSFRVGRSWPAPARLWFSPGDPAGSLDAADLRAAMVVAEPGFAYRTCWTDSDVTKKRLAAGSSDEA